MQSSVFGGTVNYGQVAGILMLDSTIPRIPGDPGHAETFSFPVRYGVIHEFPFEDLIEIRRDNLGRILSAALDLQKEGVSFIAADCGLFSAFQRDIANALDIPFIGSSLSLIPLIAGFLSLKQKIGIITGDTHLLKEYHLQAVGADSTRLVIRGMEHSQEFQDVVIKRGMRLNPDAMKTGVLTAAEALFSTGAAIGAILLECTNLVSFRSDIQRRFNVPVFDMVSLIEFFAAGYRLLTFKSAYLSACRD
jgi:aspartate/glutamate racemase